MPMLGRAMKFAGEVSDGRMLPLDSNLTNFLQTRLRQAPMPYLFPKLRMNLRFATALVLFASSLSASASVLTKAQAIHANDDGCCCDPNSCDKNSGGEKKASENPNSNSGSGKNTAAPTSESGKKTI